MRRSSSAVLARRLLAASPGAGGLARRAPAVSFDGRLSPHVAAARTPAPVTSRSTARSRTTDGSHPPPLREISSRDQPQRRISIDGLPICTAAGAAADHHRGRAGRCRAALVGRGRFAANVASPARRRSPPGRVLAFNSRSGAAGAAPAPLRLQPGPATFVLPFKIIAPGRPVRDFVLDQNPRARLGLG